MIEIIPKPLKKIPPWKTILFSLSLILILFLFLIFGLIFYLEKNLKDNLQKIETLLEEKASSYLSLEKEIGEKKRKIEDFLTLLSLHSFPSKFFNFLESLTHPKIFFSKIYLDVKGAQAILSGQAENFLSLGQQIDILKLRPEIETINLSEVLVEEGKGIKFTLNLSLKRDIFK